MPEGRIRASDADRDRTAALLQEHHAAGRLTVEEFGERIDAALQARTLGELDQLLADLPHIDLNRYTLPDASLHRPPAQGLLPGAGIKPGPHRLYDQDGYRSRWRDCCRARGVIEAGP